MFTGIIDHCGEIVAIDPTPMGCCLTIASQFTQLVLGESIAVDGVCLTVTDIKQGVFCCDVSPETMAVTTLANYHKGLHVNLERAVAVGERMGGHYVTGHVDCMITVAALQQHDDYLEVQLSGFTREQAVYLIPKGSITVNGVSLTINSVTNMAQPLLSLLLVPHTLSVTNLASLQADSQVNIEFDYYAKVIAYQLALHAQAQETTADVN